MWSVQPSQRRLRHAARGKEGLLESAARVIAQRGLDHTRFTDVSEATGVAVSTLQYYFGSREDLLIAVVEQVTQQELHELHEITLQPVDPRRQLVRLITVALGEGDAFAESSILWIEIRRAALRNAEIRSLYLQRCTAWLTVFRDVVQEGIQQTLFPQTVNADDVARQVLALVDGLAIPLLIEDQPLDRDKAQQLVTATAAALLKSTLPDSV
jgi:AcrR family transcriptional regulator